MKKLFGLLSTALLVGCASTAPPAMLNGDHEELSAGEKIVHWIPNVILDLYDTVDLNFSTDEDYPFGAHAQVTKLLRLGVLDTADFEILGINAYLHGEGDDFAKFCRCCGDYKVGAMFGAGAGASASIDLYEVYDLLVGLVTLNQINPADDHEHWGHDDDDDDADKCGCPKCCGGCETDDDD